MESVNVSQFRSQLPMHLGYVKAGNTVELTAHGKAVARLVPAAQPREAAKARLLALREQCQLGDVISPIDVTWDAQQ